MKKICFFTMLLMSMLALTTSVSAMEISKIEQMDHHKMWHKLKRGAINVVSSPLEIPNQIKKEYAADSEKFGTKMASTFGGTLKGVAFMGGRLVTGMWDILTFSLAVPENYEPIMRPEFICEK